MKFNIAAGVDNTTLNNIISETYKSLYPKLFKGSIKFDQHEISSVDFDINEAPTVSFISPTGSKTQLINVFENHEATIPLHLNTDEISQLADLMVPATFRTSASIKLSIDYPNNTPTTVGASLNTTINIQTSVEDGQDLFTVQVIAGTIATQPSNPTLDDVLNKALIPDLIQYLNKNILSPIKIPAIQYDKLRVSTPVPTIQSPDFVAYSALGNTQPDIPAASSWPANCVFAAVDNKVLMEMFKIPFPMGPQKSFNWKVIGGTVEAQVHAPNHIQINKDGSLSAEITADALCQLTFNAGIHKFHFGPRAQASISATFKPLLKDDSVYIAIEGIPPVPKFSFDLGIHGFGHALLKKLGLEKDLDKVLNDAIGPLIRKAFKFKPIKVWKLPSMKFTFDDQTIYVKFEQAIPSSIDSMLVINLQASVSKTA